MCQLVLPRAAIFVLMSETCQVNPVTGRYDPLVCGFLLMRYSSSFRCSEILLRLLPVAQSEIIDQASVFPPHRGMLPNLYENF